MKALLPFFPSPQSPMGTMPGPFLDDITKNCVALIPFMTSLFLFDPNNVGLSGSYFNLFCCCCCCTLKLIAGTFFGKFPFNVLFFFLLEIEFFFPYRSKT